MINRLHFPAVIAAALVGLLTLPAGVWADSPVSLSAPELPGSPSVTVTPDANGVGVDLGAGDTGLQAGAGPGGVSVTQKSRGSSPSKNAPDSQPVNGPVLQPAPRLGTEAGFGGGDGRTIFGVPATGVAPALGNSRGGGGSGKAQPASKPGAARRANHATSPDQKEPTRPWPFFEVVRTVPGAIAAVLTLLGLIALALWLGWTRNRQRLAENAFVDPVTGIANAAAFTPVLDRELERAKRYKRPLGLLLLDVSEADRDDGKLLHLRDTTLRETSGAISAEAREGDTVARLDHNRFGVICPEATAASVETRARAVEQRLEALRIHVKVGVAEREATDLSADDLVVRAASAIDDRRSRGAKGSKLRLLRAA